MGNYAGFMNVGDNSVARIGQTNFRNKRIPFGIKQRDRLYHMLLLGRTGTGKSTVLGQMMRSDLENGSGFALLDAHGDLAEEILGVLPDKRIQDVVYLNPTKPEFSPAINLLETAPKHLAVSQFLSIFKHLWPEFWGPRTEYLLRNSLLLLAESFPRASLADLPKVLTDFAFRDFLVNRLQAGDLRLFWEKEFAEYSRTFRSEAVAPILNKIGAIVLNPLLRPIFCQRRNDLNFREIMDTGKVLIANLAKGELGEDASSLLGSTLLSKLILSALSRSDSNRSERRFFAIFADEAQQFLTESSLSLFSELRKYGVAGVWATQYLASLSEKIRSGILGNIGSLIAFSLSGEDAQTLSQDFAPALRPRDLIDLSVHTFYVKLKIDGVTSHAFSAETIEPRAWTPATELDKLAKCSRPLTTHASDDFLVNRQVDSRTLF